MRKIGDSPEVGELLSLVNAVLREDEDLCQRSWWPLTTIESLFDNLRNGYLLCKIVNAIKPDIVNMARVRPDAISTTVCIQNLTLGLEGARRLGCRVMNAGAEDFLHKHVNTVSQVLSQLLVLSPYSLVISDSSKVDSVSISAPVDNVATDLVGLRNELQVLLLENDKLREQLANGKQSESQLEERLRVSQSEVAELRELLEDARVLQLQVKASSDSQLAKAEEETRRQDLLTNWHEKEDELTRAILTNEARRVNAEAELELVKKDSYELQVTIDTANTRNNILENTILELRAEVAKINLESTNKPSQNVQELKLQYEETVKVMKQLLDNEQMQHQKTVSKLNKRTLEVTTTSETLINTQNELKLKQDALTEALKQIQDTEKRIKQADKSIKMLLSAKERAEVVKEQLQAMYMAFPKHDRAVAIVFRHISVPDLEQAPLHRMTGLVKRIHKDKTMDVLVVVVQNWVMVYRPDKLDVPFECFHIDGWKVDRTTVPTQHIVTLVSKPSSTGENVMMGLELASCEEQEDWYLVLLKASKWWDEDDNVTRVLEKEKKKADMVMQKMKVVSLEEAQANRGRPVGASTSVGVSD